MGASNKKIILGTVQFGLNYGINNPSGMPANKEVNEILDYCVLNEINTLDTAVAYGTSIERIGNYQKRKGVSFEIINKIYYDAGFSVEEQVNHSLSLLGNSSFKALLIHTFDDFTKERISRKELRFLKENNKVEKIGVSVYTNDQIESVLRDELVEIIQLPFNILDNSSKRESILLKAKAAGKEIHVRSVFLQGLFFYTGKLPDVLSPLAIYLEKIRSIAGKYGVSIESLALNYVLQKPYIDKVLIGVDSLSQLGNNIRSVSDKIDQNAYTEIDDIFVNETSLLNPANWK